MDGQFRRGSMIFPVVIIVAGVVFLLNNLGLLDWNIWATLWRLWPVVLIGVGLDVLIGGRSRWGSLIVAGILLVVLSGAVWFSAQQGYTLRSGGVETVHSTLDGASSAEVDIRSGVSLLRIDTTSESNTLIKGRVEKSFGEELRQERDDRHGGAYYRLQSELFHAIPNFRGDPGGRWDLSLTDAVPINLRIATGVGKADLNLANLNLSQLKVESGVGQTIVWLPKTGRYKATLDVGVGDMTVYVPKEIAARIVLRTGLSARSVSGDYQKEDDYYISPGFHTAEHRVELELNGGVSKVTVEQR